MRFPIGRALIVAGLAVAVLGAVAVAFGLHAALPPDLLKVAAYKMVGIAALGLIVAGAAVRRLELERRHKAAGGAELPGGPDALPPPRFDGIGGIDARAARERSYVAEERREKPRTR